MDCNAYEIPLPDLRPAKPAASQHTESASFKHLFVFVRWSHWGTLVLAIFSALVVAALKTVLSIVLGKVFDVVARYGGGALDGSEAMVQVTMWCLVLCGLGGASWLANAAFLSTWVLFGEMQTKSARDTVFRRLMAKEMEWFDAQTEGIASMLVRVETQTRELQLATSQVFGFLVSDTICSLASLGIGLYYSWKLTVVLTSTLPVSLVVMTAVNAKLEPAIHEQRLQLDKASKHVISSVAAIDLVKVFNGYNQEVWQYLQAIRRAKKPYLRQAKANATQMGYLSFWIVALFVLGFWYGIGLVRQGWSPGAILTTFYATLNAFQSIEAFMPQWLVLAKGMAAGRELRATMSDTRGGKKIQRMNGSHRPAHCVGKIELHDVSFAYPSNPAEPVLHRTSFEFAPGGVTFLVGRSGSGKSTIGSLLVGFYEPRSGRISIDGNPLRILDRAWIRRNVTLIQQSSVLFKDTFFNNVALGHPDAGSVSLADAGRACDSAMLQSTLSSLPRGLDTVVGPGGYALSGGQTQKIALARARLRNPPVLILDEVTSGLDQVSKALVMESVRDWRRGKTTIFITHDVSQIATDDFVYVMDNGHLVQGGLRKELVRQTDSLFASLVASGDDGNEPAHPPGVQAPTSLKSPPPPPAAPPAPPHGSSRIKRLSRIIRQSWQAPAGNEVPKHTSFGLSTRYAGAIGARRGGWDVSADVYEAAQKSANVHEPLIKKKAGGEEAEEGGEAKEEEEEEEEEEGAVENGGRLLAHGAAAKSRHSTRSLLPSFGNPSDVPADVEEELQPHGHRGTSLTSTPIPQRSRQMSIDFIKAAGNSVKAARALHGKVERPRRRRLSSYDSKSRRWPSSVAAEEYKGLGLTAILKTVWPVLATRERAAFVLGLASCVVVAVANPAFSYCFAQLLSATWAADDEKGGAGQKWGLILFGIAVVDGAATYAGHYLLEYAGQAWVDTLRVEALKRILRQPHAWFHQARNSAQNIGECVDRDAEEMRNLVGRFLPIVVTAAAMVSASMAWAMVVSWKLTLIALAPGPVVFATVKGFSWANAAWEARCNRAAGEASAVIAEAFSNVRAVRALTLEDVFAKKLRAAADGAYAAGVGRATYGSILYGCYQSMDFFMIALVFYYGAAMMARFREISADKVLQVINLLLFSIGTATGILGTVPQISAARTAAARMLAFAGLPYGEQEESGRRGGGKIVKTPLPAEMRDLSFAYPNRPSNLVLRGVNLEIREGTSTALVGPSGCGKSTVMSLLLGLHPPILAGAPAAPGAPARPPPLRFAGVPFEELDPASLRSMVAYVPQASFLFPATVTENILYGLPESSKLRTEENAERAARAAGIHAFVSSLPEGYGTVLGDGGLTLSGGQAQRISIARALARRPLLLVMDEPTSSLDAESADTIRQTIRNLMERARGRNGGNKKKPRTAVMIATHSREMMRVVDKVVMLSDGSVVEEGPYAELMEKRGRFAALLNGGGWMPPASEGGAGGGVGSQGGRGGSNS